MGEKEPPKTLPDGVLYSFSNKEPDKVVVYKPNDRPKVWTGNVPIEQYRHLLSGKPLHRPRKGNYGKKRQERGGPAADEAGGAG
jgi:hypothetical protein